MFSLVDGFPEAIASGLIEACHPRPRLRRALLFPEAIASGLIEANIVEPIDQREAPHFRKRLLPASLKPDELI